MTLFLLIVIVYLFGALLIVIGADTWHKDELAGVAVWPVMLVFVVPVQQFKRWRRTCHKCGRRWQTREIALHCRHGEKMPAPQVRKR